LRKSSPGGSLGGSLGCGRISDLAILNDWAHTLVTDLTNDIYNILETGGQKITIEVDITHFIEIVHGVAFLALPLTDGPFLRLGRAKATVETAQPLLEKGRHDIPCTGLWMKKKLRVRVLFTLRRLSKGGT
jgi:hypothetical protein